MVPEVAKVFGAQPKELEVMFVSNDPTVNCPQALAGMENPPDYNALEQSGWLVA